jgi:hypothetical protein
MFLDEVLERRRRTSADLFDSIVRAGAEPVLMVNRDLDNVLEEEVIQVTISTETHRSPSLVGW